MIVVLTALEVERAAVVRHLVGVRAHRHATGTIFERGVLAGHPDREVVVAMTGTGNGAAAIMTERAITEFQPSAVLFVGVAGGLRDWLRLGDVVVATRVYGYHAMRSDEDGDHARPRAYEPAHDLEQTARVLARGTSWRAGLPAGEEPPQVHFDPIASGEVVLNTRTSATARHLSHHFNDAVAVETESAGVAQCGHLHRSTPTLTIRGISDFADGGKERADRGGSQELAARNAALFMRSMVAELAAERRRPTADEPPGGPSSVTNSISGTANFAIQAGVINGGIWLGEPPGLDLAALDDLTAAVAEARRTDRMTVGAFTRAVLGLVDLRHQATSPPTDPARLRALRRAIEEDLGGDAELLGRLAKVFGGAP
ncbi:purine phosphorylase [Actinosynnema sp. NPDC053489]|uniref:5'-methylthioadenosine/S-adenosylhomocysteine nucleosidase family protein n=1 Tax=Actinosynnema sp. NPDC053489 TaxID=3363916 RepID=UPI0037CB8CD0